MAHFFDRWFGEIENCVQLPHKMGFFEPTHAILLGIKYEYDTV